MKILVCYTRYPWPMTSGDRLTVSHMLHFLSERHDVDFLCVNPTSKKTALFRRTNTLLTTSQLSSVPTNLGRVETVSDTLLAKGARIAAAFFSGNSLQVALFFSAAFGKARHEMMSQKKYDVVYNHYIRSFGPQDFESFGAKKVIGLQLSHQSHFKLASAKEKNILKKWLYKLEYRRLKKHESAIASLNDLVHLISKTDLDRIQDSDSFKDKVLINPHGVDFNSFKPNPEKRVRGRVVFTGSLFFQANVDCILWFAEFVWPKIVETNEQCEWVIAGSKPTLAVRTAVEKSQQTTLIENPENMWEVLQTADVAVNPLRVGAGLQNKVLEALSCGVPMVATSLANEGIKAEDGKEIQIANTAEEFVKSINELLTNAELHSRLSTAGRNLIVQQWSWERFFLEAESRWQTLADND